MKNKIGIKKNKSLVKADPLGVYLREIQSYPILSLEEEKELARRFHEDGDVEAARRLVQTHLRIVVRIAMEYRKAYQNLLDLIQEGNIGLLQAVKHYDSTKGSRLAHYATWWIKSYILKFILDNFRLVKIGTTKEQKKLFYNLMREKERIESLGYKATPLDLSKKLGVSEDAVVQMQHRLTSPEYALDAPMRKGNGENSPAILKDFLSIDEKPVDEQMAEAQTQDILKKQFDEFAKELDERDRKIFTERLLSELPLTLQEIGDDYGITKERVRQLEDRLIKRLKRFFEDRGIEIETL